MPYTSRVNAGRSRVLAAGWATLVAAAMSFPVSAQQGDALADELNRRLASDVAPLLATYCLPCHNAEKSKGDVRLDGLRSIKDALGIVDDLEMAREMIVTRQMPPEDKTQPSDHERLILQQWLDGALDYVPPDAKPDPGWFTIHRLNRAEYRNTMRDLLGIDPANVDIAERLPPDDTGYGFDNIADVLSVSPLAVEQYLDAAERAVELGLGPIVEISTSPRPVGTLEGKGPGARLPGGGFVMHTVAAVESTLRVPLTAEYIIRITAWEDHAGDENARISLRINGKERDEFRISGTRGEPQTVETRLKLRAGDLRLGAHFTNDFYKPNVADRNLAIEEITIAGPIDEATTERPAQWRAIFARHRDIPSDPDRAAAILSRFAARAYRRPLEPAEEAALASFYQAGTAEGLSFEASVRRAMIATLTSPKFLFRTVANPRPNDPAHTYALGDHELASRLSYFLWSSTPDDELLDLAARGELRTPETLRAQVRRMIADPKSAAFVENFAGQWLQLRALDSLALDTARFPEFDGPLRTSMAREAQLFFADILRNNRSVLEFIRSDSVFVNDRLASLYGIEGDFGPSFQRVTLPPDSPRGGVITMAAVLAVTSNTTRTSPVKRGLYVLDQILGAPPPPPPADIPPLDQTKLDTPNPSMREKLAAHVANPTCAVCHNRLDPIGFALENFGATGRWRLDDEGNPIDALGTLPGGETFNGPIELKKTLMGKSDQFVEAFAAKVLTYALGRGMEPFDRPAVRAITASTRADGDRFGSLIEAVVLSESFRTCRGREVHHD